MISAQTLRVCREGKPVPIFPDHALGKTRQGVGSASCTAGEAKCAIGTINPLRSFDSSKVDAWTQSIVSRQQMAARVSDRPTNDSVSAI
jgi:hypothetical protein